MFTVKKSSQKPFKYYAFSTTLVLSLGSAVPVLADSISHQSAISEAEQVYLFNFSSKPLPQAIAEFSAVSGVQVLYTEQSVYKHQAPALNGSYSPSEAPLLCFPIFPLLLEWGANVGGFGLAIGSFANLIVLRLGKQPGLWLPFHAWSIAMLLISLLGTLLLIT